MNYLLAKSNTVSGYGGCTYQEISEDDVYDGRYAQVISASFPSDDAAFIVGFWMTPTTQALPQSIVYRADQNFIARIVDADGWRWWWPLPSTSGAWSQAYFAPENAQLTDWQPKPAEDPRPSTLNMVPVDQITILLDGAATDATFAYYAVNELPPYVRSIVPTSFGPLRIKVGTDVALPASGFYAGRFGASTVILGMPPSAMVLPAAAGVRPASFGTPSVRSSLVLDSPQSLRPIIVGRPMMAMALHAQVLQPVSFGIPGQAAVLPAQPLGYAQFGRPALAMHLPATSTAKVRFGRPRVALATAVLGADSLEPVRFSTIAMAGISLRARTLTNVSFGRPAVDRGAIC